MTGAVISVWFGGHTLLVEGRGRIDRRVLVTMPGAMALLELDVRAARALRDALDAALRADDGEEVSTQ